MSLLTAFNYSGKASTSERDYKQFHVFPVWVIALTTFPFL